MPKNLTEPDHCELCGKPFFQKKGKGPPRKGCPDCATIRGHIVGMRKLLYQVEFDNVDALVQIRGEIMGEIINGPLHANIIRRKIKQKKTQA